MFVWGGGKKGDINVIGVECFCSIEEKNNQGTITETATGSGVNILLRNGNSRGLSYGVLAGWLAS